MPNLSKPCPRCEGVARHKATCPEKGKGRGRAVPPEERLRRFREMVRALGDKEFALFFRATLAERDDRRKRIHAEAAARLEALDEIEDDPPVASARSAPPPPAPPPAPEPLLCVIPGCVNTPTRGAHHVAKPDCRKAEPTTSKPGTFRTPKPETRPATAEPVSGARCYICGEVHPAGRPCPPKRVCGAMCPDDPAVKCTQTTLRDGKHEGLHRNAEVKKTWAQRGPSK